ncbi:hypothetical protein J2848_003817 [Azospirillum lipoferum]|uniref:C1 family peptidase n=1 Tax=Azospirillum lipoferum TaxID=193 RepID=A0A5A9GEC7_AZOLI|nr:MULTISPECIES: C1 family peptidase [Azospirillum]KAA0591992.1 C1 family peptidase [Azospirillum lipoferum]MCP1612137.1 hypothetical protein [Azospirillum lipoferum]MDW5536637.1 C1 family peptidase [Azospirillum sp. NL1]
MLIKIIHDLRGKFGLVREQGERMTCLAFAMSDAHAAFRGAFVPLSVEHLYWHCMKRTPNANPDEGTNMPTVRMSLKEDGQALEDQWRYLPQLPAELSEWQPPPSATPVLTCRSLPLNGATALICQYLAAGKPVVIAFAMSDAFYNPNEDGVVEAPDNDAPAGHHAVVVVGCGNYKNRRYLLLRNSWSADWGKDGHAWVSETYIDPRIHAAAIMVA